MTSRDAVDPLAVLRAGDLPVQPDPAFAGRLRSRLEAALRLPTGTEGVEMSGTTEALAELTKTAAPPPRPAALPYLSIADARAAIEWYGAAFGAVVIGEPIVMDDGRIGHAELAISGGVLYLADDYPELGLKHPEPEHVSVGLMLHVADTDAAVVRARDNGATVVREAYENYGSRNATITDPFGHRWMFSGPMATATARIQHGDVGYVSLWTPDPGRAAAFYGRVLGWTYDPASRQITNTAQPLGIAAGADEPTFFCAYAVTDLQLAGHAIIEAGGRLGEVSQHGDDTVLDATDPVGTAFAVYQPGGDAPRPQLNGAGPGELSYITYEVGDSSAFRDFYTRVLHWQFEPGRVDDGWQVTQTHPMAGVAGSNAQSVTVPMWTVANIDDAVAKVREAGGSVIQEPAEQPYGRMAECRDDQGARFYLGEF